MTNAPYIPQEVLDAATVMALQTDLRVLQGYRLAPTDAGHVSALLRYMDPSEGATVLDVGCGFGEVARLMQEERPDLRFVLLNSNALQLSHAPKAFLRILGDMHALPLAAGSVDVVMFCYSLCHSDFDVALAEASRVARHGATLFAFDYDRIDGDNALMEMRLCARAVHFSDLAWLAQRWGWVPVMLEYPDGDDTIFRQLYDNDAEYDLIFRDLRPVVWRMVRQ